MRVSTCILAKVSQCSCHSVTSYGSTGAHKQAVDYNSRTLFHGGEELGDALQGGLGRELLAGELAPLHQQRLCHGLGRVT